MTITRDEEIMESDVSLAVALRERGPLPSKTSQPLA